MERRKFIALLGGAAAWPLAAHAQPIEHAGDWLPRPKTLEALADRLRAFREGLKDTGYMDGENVTAALSGPPQELKYCPYWRI
jgi:putative tryptophan/tyrosine transport system substrate-binding protein